MDKRFFIFVLSMTVLFFFINQYYTTKKEREYQQYRAKQEEIAKEQKILKEREIVERTAKVQDLPIVPIYVEGAPLSWAVKTGEESYLTIAREDNSWPETLTTHGRAITFVQADGHFALYSASAHPSISSIHIPQAERYDLQVVSFIDNNRVEVVLAEFQDGHLSFPAVAPQSDAIALYPFEGIYFPVGVYTRENSTFTPISQLPHLNPLTTYKTQPLKMTDKQEFYILENESMQVVFSNMGGAIAEINLPFKAKHHPSSVVLPIGVDRTIEKEHTNNALFPLNAAYIVDRESGKPLLKQPSQGGYYPLLRRGIKSEAHISPYPLPPRYYACSTISEDPATSQASYTLVHFDDNMIQFEAKLPSRRIIKTYRFPKGEKELPYCLIASIKVEGNTSGVWLSSGVPEVELISGNAAPIIKYSTLQNNNQVVEKLSMPKVSTTISSLQPDWVANSNGYFALIMDPLDEVGNGFQVNHISGALDPSRTLILNSANQYSGYEVYLPLKHSFQPMTFRLYAGPLDQKTLKRVDAACIDPTTGYNPKYIETQSFHGWFAFISEPFAKLLYFIMNFFHTLTGSWGISILFLAVVLRVIMYPLNAWSIKSTLKLQEVSPKLKKLQDKYKHDPKKGQMEMLAFYREHKVNPFGGCLPIIIQMPFLFGLFDLLKSTFSLRGASFIPGWIDNLTAPDVLFSWNYSLPFLGTEFHLLPILLGVIMFVQQKMTSAQNKGVAMTEQQKQQQKMGMIMTIVFTLMFYKLPSGLNIYWFFSMILQIVQQWYTSKRKKIMKNYSEEIIIGSRKK